MSDTHGHRKRTKSWGEAWGKRASFAGVVGWWLDSMAKRITHRAERRESKRIERESKRAQP
jgi:hypothetical protein